MGSSHTSNSFLISLLVLALVVLAAAFFYGVRTRRIPLNALLTQHGTAPADSGCSLADLLRRPQVGYADLAPMDPARPDLPRAVWEEVEITVKYEGYIARQLRQVEEFRRMEERPLPPDTDYEAVPGLRTEARQKLAAIRPVSFGQASRISGVSPADMAALMIWAEKRKRG